MQEQRGAGLRIEEFNALGTPQAAAVLRPCVDIDSWVDALVANRPYPDVEALAADAARQATGWTGAEVEAAIADHPRIGERHRGGADADMSRREQAGVDRDDGDLQARLREGNRAYEERFGRIYLVRAAGRTGDEMLALLEERLTHDPLTELEVTKGQLAEIAVLRLKGQFA
jgi:2-oxo-4-hydroxy-4-carboxy-5-ureidoimidazoline decarboxylase